MELEMRVTQHAKSETADKEPKYTVILQGVTPEKIIVKLSMKCDSKDLLDDYPLKSTHALKCTNPQTTLT
jgi:hypothetical protein